MTEGSSYQTPRTESNQALVEQVASGQKLVIYAILLNIVVIILELAVHRAFGLLGLVVLVMSIMGVVRLADGVGASVVAKIIYIILMFIPLINLITLLVLNSRATRILRANGYQVGLLGASK